MILRFGKVLNGNRNFYETRGQTPLLGWSVENYLKAKKDDDEVAMTAYPLLEREYVEYWNGPGHSTPVGLSTCHDDGKYPVYWNVAAGHRLRCVARAAQQRPSASGYAVAGAAGRHGNDQLVAAAEGVFVRLHGHDRC